MAFLGDGYARKCEWRTEKLEYRESQNLESIKENPTLWAGLRRSLYMAISGMVKLSRQSQCFSFIKKAKSE